MYDFMHSCDSMQARGVHMGFQFQVNQNLDFDHNTELLKIAEENKPTIFHTKKDDVRVVKCVKEKSKLGGYWIQEVATDENKAYGKGDSLILDFKEHVVGTFSIKIGHVGSPMDAPLHLGFRFCEMPCELEEDSSTYDGWLSSSWIQEEVCHIDELPCTLSLPRRYSFRYVKIFVLDTSPKWKVVFSDAEVDALSCVKNCSIPHIQDKELDAIYRVGLHTLHDCMQDVFEDGPKRDRRLWLGDLRLQALSNYASYRQVDIVKRCIALFCGMRCRDGRVPANVFVRPTYIPDDTFLFDYSLFLISCVYDYICETQDIAFLELVYPVLQSDMQACLVCVDRNGRFHMDEKFPLFIDWSDTFDKETCGSAILVYTLRQLIALGKQIHQDVRQYESTLQEIEEDIRNSLYDAKKHIVHCASGEINLATQVWVVLAGVFNQEENHKIMAEAMHQFFPVKGIATPYMYHHIVEALFVSDWKEDAIALMKAYWGAMISLGGDTFFEAFDPNDPNYSPYGSTIVNSYCHAWSCTPVYLIHKYVLNGE